MQNVFIAIYLQIQFNFVVTAAADFVKIVVLLHWTSWLCHELSAIAVTRVWTWVWLTTMLFITLSNDTLNPVPGDICRPGGGRPSDRQEILTCLPATTGVVVNDSNPGFTGIVTCHNSPQLKQCSLIPWHSFVTISYLFDSKITTDLKCRICVSKQKIENVK